MKKVSIILVIMLLIINVCTIPVSAKSAEISESYIMEDSGGGRFKFNEYFINNWFI